MKNWRQRSNTAFPVSHFDAVIYLYLPLFQVAWEIVLVVVVVLVIIRSELWYWHFHEKILCNVLLIMSCLFNLKYFTRLLPSRLLPWWRPIICSDFISEIRMTFWIFHAVAQSLTHQCQVAKKGHTYLQKPAAFSCRCV